MAKARLLWTDPTKRVDGSILTPFEIASVHIFDTAAPDPTIPIGIILDGVQTFTTDILSVGDHTFTVIVNDTAGHASAPSNTATVTVQATLANPNPVADLTANLID